LERAAIGRRSTETHLADGEALIGGALAPLALLVLGLPQAGRELLGLLFGHRAVATDQERGE
jgi:hypothetical protein